MSSSVGVGGGPSSPCGTAVLDGVAVSVIFGDVDVEDGEGEGRRRWISLCMTLAPPVAGDAVAEEREEVRLSESPRLSCELESCCCELAELVLVRSCALNEGVMSPWRPG